MPDPQQLFWQTCGVSDRCGAYGGRGPDCVDIDHPVQQACLGAFEEATDRHSPTFGIDGCSAPNFATTVHGLARAMAWFASAGGGSDRQSRAAATLTNAMMQHPDLVAGKGRSCTQSMRAMRGTGAVKTGAEGVFAAILPDKQVGVALKITDRATRASECAIAAILVSLGVLEPDHPATGVFMNAPIRNRRDIQTGTIKPAAGLIF